LKKSYSRVFSDEISAFCPGCTHGLVTKIIRRVVAELGIVKECTGIIGIGCSELTKPMFEFDCVGSPHGKAAAVATGIVRCNRNRVAFVYQGDGDGIAIGLSETLHAANRGEKFASFLINNGKFGMTGGQMAPTTVIGQKTSTTPDGRRVTDGHPMKMCEIISQLDAPVYVARFALNSPKNVQDAEKGIRKAFEYQIAGKGYTFVELLSNCPIGLSGTPVESLKMIDEISSNVFKLGVFRDVYGGVGK